MVLILANSLWRGSKRYLHKRPAPLACKHALKSHQRNITKAIQHCNTLYSFPSYFATWVAMALAGLARFRVRTIYNKPSTWICLFRPSRCPSHHCRCTIWWEMLIEHHPIPVALFTVWYIRPPFLLRVLHHFIGNVELGIVL